MPILLAATSALAQTTDQASSSIDVQQTGEAAAAHIVNRDFVFDSRLMKWGAERPTRLMLEITTDTTQRDDAEGFAAAIEVGYGVVRDELLAKITTALARMHEPWQAVGGAAS